MMISSKLPSRTASWTDSNGSGPPTSPSTCPRAAGVMTRSAVSSVQSPALRSATSGISRANSQGPSLARVRTASIRRGVAAVRLATIRTRVLRADWIGCFLGDRALGLAYRRSHLPIRNASGQASALESRQTTLTEQPHVASAAFACRMKRAGRRVKCSFVRRAAALFSWCGGGRVPLWGAIAGFVGCSRQTKPSSRWSPGAGPRGARRPRPGHVDADAGAGGRSRKLQVGRLPLLGSPEPLATGSPGKS